MQKPNLILDLDNTLIVSYLFNVEFIDYFIELEDEIKYIYLDQYPELACFMLYDRTYCETHTQYNTHLCNFTINNTYYIVYMRPGLINFINYVFDVFDVSIYTLAMEDYANQIINAMNSYFDIAQFKNIYSNNKFDYKLTKSLSDKNINENFMIIDDQINVWCDDYDRKYVFNIKPFDSINKCHNDSDTILYDILTFLSEYVDCFKGINENTVIQLDTYINDKQRFDN